MEDMRACVDVFVLGCPSRTIRLGNNNRSTVNRNRTRLEFSRDSGDTEGGVEQGQGQLYQKVPRPE